MAKVDLDAIGPLVPFKPTDPLTEISGWQDYANKVSEGKNLVQTNRKTEQEMAMKRVEFMLPRFGSLANKPGPVTEQDFHALIQQGVKEGYLTKEHAAAAMEEIPKGGTDEQYRQYAHSKRQQGLSVLQQLDVNAKKIEWKDLGGELAPVAEPSKTELTQPNPQIRALPGRLAKTPTVESLNELVEIELPSGLKDKAPRWAYNGLKDGSLKLLPDHTVVNANGSPASPGGGGGGKSSSDGRYPKPTPKTDDVDDYLTPPGQRPKKEVDTSLPNLSQGGVQRNPQTASVNQKAADDFVVARNRSNDLENDERQLIDIHDKLTNPAVITGQGSNPLVQLRNYVTTFNRIRGAEITQKDIDAADQNTLIKMMTRIMRNDGAAGQSVAQLEASAHGNMGQYMDKLTNMHLSTLMLGINRQKQLEYKMVGDQQTGRDFYKAKEFAAGLNPIALAFNTMDEKAQEEYRDSLKGDARREFNRSLVVAKRYGLLDKKAVKQEP